MIWYSFWRRNAHDFKIIYIKLLEIWNRKREGEIETGKMNKNTGNSNILLLIRVYDFLIQEEKKCLSLTIYKKYPSGYLIMITPLGNDILISILPEGLGIYRSPRLCLQMANKIFPSDEEILLKKKKRVSFLPLLSVPINQDRQNEDD